MFDVGFFELIVIALIGLFVIGPERLPSAIRTVAMWVGRARYFITETRSEFEKQIGADDIRRELHNEQVMRSLETLKQSKDDLENSIKESQNSILAPQDKDEELPDHYPHDEHGHAVLDHDEKQAHNNNSAIDSLTTKNSATVLENKGSDQTANVEKSSSEDNRHGDEIQHNTAPSKENIQATPTK